MLRLMLWTSIFFCLVAGKFKSLNCQSFDLQMSNFSKCEIKALSRTRNSIDITLNIFQSLRTSPIVKVAFFKRANGWRPFLYDFNIDFCKFMQNPNHFIARLAFQYLKPYSNLNHSCPYNPGTSVIVKNFELNVDAFRSRFPIENGEYAVSLSFILQNKLRFSMNGSIYYFNYKET